MELRFKEWLTQNENMMGDWPEQGKKPSDGIPGYPGFGKGSGGGGGGPAMMKAMKKKMKAKSKKKQRPILSKDK